MVPQRATARGPAVALGSRLVGAAAPVFVIAEIGINHNGSLELAKRLIDGAVQAGCDAVKFQKRDPEACVPRHQWHIERETPWGKVSYIDYRRRIELSLDDYAEIDRYCRQRGIPWFASCFDEPSVRAIAPFDPPCFKVASASLTDGSLLSCVAGTGRPIMLSTGMSTLSQLDQAVATLSGCELLLAHTVSIYPAPPEQLNLRLLATLRERYPHCPVGYSGHERELAPTLAAVALGATFVERHITLDREMWGSDHAASLDLAQLQQLVTSIRTVELALGDGVKRLLDDELIAATRLRGGGRA